MSGDNTSLMTRCHVVDDHPPGLWNDAAARAGLAAEIDEM
jgi:hypothetical protein